MELDYLLQSPALTSTNHVTQGNLLVYLPGGNSITYLVKML